MKKLLKSFKNFRLTAYIEAAAGAISVIAGFVLLILYQTNLLRVKKVAGKSEYYELLMTGFKGGNVRLPGFEGAPGLEHTVQVTAQPIAGMMIFLMGILTIIFGIVAVYASLPYIFKRHEKLEANRALPWFGVAAAIFLFIEIMFAFVMIGIPGSRNNVGVILVSILGFIAIAVQLAMIYPTLTVRINKEEQLN